MPQKRLFGQPLQYLLFTRLVIYYLLIIALFIRVVIYSNRASDNLAPSPRQDGADIDNF